MKKALLCVNALLCSIVALAQVQPTAPSQGNLNGTLFAIGYGGWSVPMGNNGPFSWSSGAFCTTSYGGTTFPAFTEGTPIEILDQINPAIDEQVWVTAVQQTPEQCAITTTTPAYLHTQFSLGSATAGLQEAINANLGTTAPLTVQLTPDWFRAGGTLSLVLSTITGNSLIGIEDETKTPSAWYRWNGSNYVLVGIGGSSQLGTLFGDTLYNDAGNDAAADANIFIATAPAVTSIALSPQAAVNAAAANNGSVVLQPGVARTRFTNVGNVRVQDNRSDVPATARGVTEFGAACDLRSVYGTLTQGSTTVTILPDYSALFSSADLGRVLVAAGSVGGTPTQFESAIASITDANHAVMTTAAPFNQTTAHQMDLGTDDTAAVTQALVATASYGAPAGALVFPEGNCLTHTQVLAGQSPVGLGPGSEITGFPGEDIFAAPDPSQTTGLNQGPAHIHDLTFYVDGRIDATLPWQIINDSGTTAKAANYRPIAQSSAVTSDPLAPGWFQGPGPNLSGAINGAASITASSAVMCVPSTETAPSVGQTVVFPYLTSVFTATVSSTSGSCTGGATPRTLSAALPTGATNAQAEWFSGASPQSLATSIGSGSCPSTITLSNSIGPAPGYEVNVAPFGLIQIDAEQFSYFGKSNANNPSPANTLYGVQCAQNGTTRAAHAGSATVVPLNQFKPTYPWPVIPTLNTGDTTPAGTAGFFPGWNVGNAAFAFPIASGAGGPGGSAAWTANAKIEDLSFYPWPVDINGLQWGEVNHTAPFYFVQPYYAAHFTSILIQYLFYGIAEGPPSIENGNWLNAQPTADGSSWDDVAIWAANPLNIPLGNQVTYNNFNAYSNEATTSGTGLGADTCYYFNSLVNDQGGGGEANSVDVMTNFYCEPEGGAHTLSMPNWEWDTSNSQIINQHMGGPGEVAIGGQQQHWQGGNFNNSPSVPAINYGPGNSSDLTTDLGGEPKSNVYGVGSLINYQPNSKFSGTTAQAFGTATGPYGAIQTGNSREPIPAQTNETFNTGNTTVPYPSSGGGFITPEEFNASFAFESQAMTTGWTYDSTSPVTGSYAACTVGTNVGTAYCSTSKFNQQQISIAPGQRLAPGKYTMYVSMKDAVTSSNTETFTVGSNCGGVSNTYTIPITNAWPAPVFTSPTPIDFTAATGGNCYLTVNFQGATSADSIQIGYLDFAPYAENLRANTITVNNIITPTGPNGGTPTGCASSPVTGIDTGYTCPTKGWGTTLSANQLIGDLTISLSGSLAGLSPSGCFFVDSEYECYTGISGGTLTGLTRGAYTTTAAGHSNGAQATAVDLVLGSIQQAPANVIVGGGTANTILSINNGLPNNHGGANVFEINGGSDETWFNQAGTVQQTNPSDLNRFQSPLDVGNVSLYGHPNIIDTQQVLQNNGQNQTYSPLGLGGGVAGSVNITQPATVGAPHLFDFSGGGSTTRSYVCSGIDTDGNLIPGTTATLTTTAASFSFPQFVSVVCPQAAGVSQFQIWRTVGGPSQGLLSTTSSTQSAGFQDFNGATGGGTPPGSNTSNPHLSIAGSGTPCMQLGPTQVCTGTGAPTSTCGTAPVGSGSLWLRTDGGASTSVYSCASTTWTAVTVP